MLNKILNRIAADIGWVISGLILILNILFIGELRQVVEHVSIEHENLLVIIISVISSFALFYIMSRIGKKVEKKSKKEKIIVVSILLAIYAGLSIAWINYIPVKPVADSKEIYTISKALYEHTGVTDQSKFYLGIYPHQIGITMMFTVLFKIFHTSNFVILQVVNVICNIVTLVFMYLMLKKFFKEYKPNFGIYWWMSLTFLPLILLSTYIYGDYVGLMFTTIGLYFIMKYGENEKVRYLIISGIAIALSILSKKNYCVPMLAILIYLILLLISKKRNIKDTILKIFLIVLFIGISVAPEMLVNKYVDKKMGLLQEQEFPTASYLAFGITETDRGCGWYNDEIVMYAMFHTGEDYDYYDVIIKDRLNEFKNNPNEMFRFYNNKVISMWTDPTFQCIWYNYPLHLQQEGASIDEFIASNKVKESFYKKGTISDFIMRYDKALLILIYAGITIFAFIKRKDISNNAILLITVLLGGFFFHLLWEAKGRYVMPYVILVFPIATLGVSMLCDKLSEKIKKLGKNMSNKKNKRIKE